jgi:glycosyltransferase involved in cell wall biosynthesis
VGSIQPRKNLTRLLSAYERLRRTRPEGSLPQLVLVGKRAWLYRETLKAIEKLGTGVIVTGYVPETDLPALYSGALCFVYPSFLRGLRGKAARIRERDTRGQQGGSAQASVAGKNK